MGILDKVGGGLAQLDPTTKEGQLNLLTGGLYGATDKPLQSIDDSISGQEQKNAARNAANAKEEAGLASIALQEKIYNEGQAKLDPFYQGGLGSLDDYLGLIDPRGASDFKANYLQSDEFQNILGQGTNQLASNAAFSGALGSGGTLKNVADYTTDQSFNLSNQALNNEISRLGGGVGLAQSAAGAQISAGQNFGNQASQQYGNIADAQAAHSLAGASTGLNPYLQLAGTGAQNLWSNSLMVTTTDIVNFGQQTSPLLRGLNAVAQGAGAIRQGLDRRDKQDMAAKRQQAYGLLSQAFNDSSDDAATGQLIEQARTLDPELTLQVQQMINKDQAQPVQQVKTEGLEGYTFNPETGTFSISPED